MWVGSLFRVKSSPVAPAWRRSRRGTGAGPETAPPIVLRSRRGSRRERARADARRARERFPVLLVAVAALVLAGGMVLAAL